MQMKSTLVSDIFFFLYYSENNAVRCHIIDAHCAILLTVINRFARAERKLYRVSTKLKRALPLPPKCTSTPTFATRISYSLIGPTGYVFVVYPLCRISLLGEIGIIFLSCLCHCRLNNIFIMMFLELKICHHFFPHKSVDVIDKFLQPDILYIIRNSLLSGKSWTTTCHPIKSGWNIVLLSCLFNRI